ncbi:MAG: HAD-IC family P-type ATPase, partial [Oscillospiraceae bacterium]
DGEKKPFNMTELNKRIDELANRAIRVLAIATSEDALGEESLPEGNNWTLVGVVGIRDEVRPESVTAISEVKGAGVQVVMITGDRKETAVAIAKEAGLLEKDTDIVLTSDELAQLSDEEIKQKLPNIRVIARALPSDKSRLVRLAQELDLVAGMTGDGVNDSPALKKADVGFAMGGGTEVAKEASDIVILDDNFNSIDRAILYGRTIFNSIRKFIVFQLTINVSAVLISFICPLIGLSNPLSVIQILWVNLVMDTLAALAFGGEPALSRYMHEKPKRRTEPIISRNMMSQIITGAAWTFILSLAMLILGTFDASSAQPGISFLESWGLIRESDIAGEAHAYLHTAYFAFFIFIAVFNAFNARTDKCNLFDNLTKNKGFLMVFGIIAVVQILMTYLGNAILSGYGLNVVEWLMVLVMAISIIPVDLVRKAIANAAEKK